MAGLNPSQCTSATLRLWLDATQGVYKDAGVTAAVAGTDTVQQWNDQSTNANNFTQATAANRPSYVTDSGNKGVKMNSTSPAWMSTTGSITPNRHVFFVCKWTAQVTQCTFWGHTTNIDWLGTTDGTKIYDDSATATGYSYIVNDQTPLVWVQQIPVDARMASLKIIDDWLIYEFQPTGATTTNQFRDRTFTNRSPDAIFGDVASFDTALSSSDRTSLYQYFRGKYSLPLLGDTLSAGGSGVSLARVMGGL